MVPIFLQVQVFSSSILHVWIRQKHQVQQILSLKITFILISFTYSFTKINCSNKKKCCLCFDCQQLDKERTFERVRNGNSDVEHQVKSRAVVKYSAVQVPSNFARLQCNTDLNLPPSNWLTSTAESYGLQHVLSKSTGFSRLVCVSRPYCCELFRSSNYFYPVLAVPL